MPVDNKTTTQNYKLPDGANNISDDVLRLIDALNAIDAGMAARITEIAGKAAVTHTHPIVQVTGLQNALDAKVDTSHTYSLDDLSDVDASVSTAGQYLGRSAGGWQPKAIPIADVTSLQASLDAKAPLASPLLTGTPAGPTPAAGTNTTQLATTAFVQAAVSALINGSPAALDTLKELADAIGDDANFATTITTALGLRALLDGNSIQLPSGPTSSRPASPAGPRIRYNTTTGVAEVFNGTAWVGFDLTSALLKTNNLADLTDVPAARKALLTPALDNGHPGLLINPVMTIAQRFGLTGTSFSGSGGDYPLDSWAVSFSASGLAFNASQIALPSVFSSAAGFKGFSNAFRVAITTPKASYAAGDNFSPILQIVEGLRFAKMGWGTADAKDALLIAIVSASVAGTYPIPFRNYVGTRSYVTTATLAANTPTVVLRRIPGDTGGTWQTGAVGALTLTMGNVAGTTYQAPTLNTWLSGNYLSHASCVNWSATNGATLDCIYGDIFPYGTLPIDETVAIGTEQLSRLLLMSRPTALEAALAERYSIGGSGTIFRTVAGGSFGGGLTNHLLRTRMRTTPAGIISNLTGSFIATPASVYLDRSASFWFASGTGVGDYTTFDYFLSAYM